MASFPTEILLGIYLGLLVGVVPALVSWGLGFGVRYLAGVSVPRAGVSLVAILVAGGNGVLLVVTDQQVVTAPGPPRLVTALIVVTMLSLYAHTTGERLAADVPHRLSRGELREKTLSPDQADYRADGEEVRIRVTGEVTDMAGYPPIPEELRATLRNAELTLPGDLRLSEIERRVEDRLQQEYDLGAVSVTVDERGRATVVAAPPFSGLSKRVDHDRHAVSVSGLIPTGLVHGDEVTVITPNAQVRGTVLSVDVTDNAQTAPDIAPLSNDEPVGDDTGGPVRAPASAGGEGRLTVAVTRTDVQVLLRADEVKVVVEPRGTRREYEVISTLRQAENQFRRFVVGPESQAAGRRLGAAMFEDDGVDVLAVGKTEGWLVAPDSQTTLEAGDELFAVGDRDALDEFESSGLTGGEPAL